MSKSVLAANNPPRVSQPADAVSSTLTRRQPCSGMSCGAPACPRIGERSGRSNPRRAEPGRGKSPGSVGDGGPPSGRRGVDGRQPPSILERRGRLAGNLGPAGLFPGRRVPIGRVGPSAGGDVAASCERCHRTCPLPCRAGAGDVADQSRAGLRSTLGEEATGHCAGCRVNRLEGRRTCLALP